MAYLIDLCHFQWSRMTLKVIGMLQGFSNAIRQTFVQHFARFQLTQLVARSLGDSRVSCVCFTFYAKLTIIITTAHLRQSSYDGDAIWRKQWTSWVCLLHADSLLIAELQLRSSPAINYTAAQKGRWCLLIVNSSAYRPLLAFKT